MEAGLQAVKPLLEQKAESDEPHRMRLVKWTASSSKELSYSAQEIFAWTQTGKHMPLESCLYYLGCYDKISKGIVRGRGENSIQRAVLFAQKQGIHEPLV